MSCVQANFLFQYIDFFNALVDDWVGAEPPDLLEFVPVDWNVGIDMSNYEIYLHTSRYNWIDITTEGKENCKYVCALDCCRFLITYNQVIITTQLFVSLSIARLAFCGKTGHIGIEFPFTEFLPIEQRVNFIARVS